MDENKDLWSNSTLHTGGLPLYKNKIFWIISLAIVFSAVAGFISRNKQEEYNYVYSNVSRQDICRAAIATIMGREISIVNVSHFDGYITYLYYNRPNDGSSWSYRCKIIGNNIIWSTYGNGTASTTGRWRDSASDSRITFYEKDGYLNITEDYGDSKNSQTFLFK